MRASLFSICILPSTHGNTAHPDFLCSSQDLFWGFKPPLSALVALGSLFHKKHKLRFFFSLSLSSVALFLGTAFSLALSTSSVAAAAASLLLVHVIHCPLVAFRGAVHVARLVRVPHPKCFEALAVTHKLGIDGEVVLAKRLMISDVMSDGPMVELVNGWVEVVVCLALVLLLHTTSSLLTTLYSKIDYSSSLKVEGESFLTLGQHSHLKMSPPTACAFLPHSEHWW
jgi:hypothetical protein